MCADTARLNLRLLGYESIDRHVSKPDPFRECGLWAVGCPVMQRSSQLVSSCLGYRVGYGRIGLAIVKQPNAGPSTSPTADVRSRTSQWARIHHASAFEMQQILIVDDGQ